MTRNLRIAAIFGIVGTLSGCGGSGIIGQQLPRVRVFNGVDNQASVSLAFSDSSGKSLGNSPTAPFGGVAPTDTIIANTNARASVSAGGTPLFTGSSFLYRINSLYTVYSGGVPGDYVTLVVNDNRVGGTVSGVMNIRAVHIGAKTPAVDIYVEPAGTNGVSGSAVFLNLGFGQVTSSANSSVAVDNNGYTTDAAIVNGAYEIVVTAHNSPTPIATTTAVLNPTVYYTVAVSDGKAGTGSAVQLLLDYH